MDANGIVNLACRDSVDFTVAKLRSILEEKGVKLFAEIDHSGEAERAGFKMPPTRLLIFGSPKAGTPVMLAAPSIALDLPLKILVWQDATGKTWLSYHSTDHLRARHNVPAELARNLAAVEVIAALVAV